MMSLFFYDKDSIYEYEVSETVYKVLATEGLEKVNEFTDKVLTIDGEEYEISVSELTKESRDKYVQFVEKITHNELKKIFNKLDSNPSIKEIRISFASIKEFTELIDMFNEEKYLYFSIE